jgi:hypothetical protein
MTSTNLVEAVSPLRRRMIEDIDHSLTEAFTGKLSGLTNKNAVDLADLTFTQGKMTAAFSGTAAGGTLTVTNVSTNQSVALNLLGDFRAASWVLSQDSSKTGTLIVDPPVNGPLTPDVNGHVTGGFGLSEISVGANTTLAYAANNENAGDTSTISDGLHAQSLALLGQYAASGFVTASGGHGGTLITDPPPNQEQLMLQPHA